MLQGRRILHVLCGTSQEGTRPLLWGDNVAARRAHIQVDMRLPCGSLARRRKDTSTGPAHCLTGPCAWCSCTCCSSTCSTCFGLQQLHATGYSPRVLYNLPHACMMYACKLLIAQLKGAPAPYEYFIKCCKRVLGMVPFERFPGTEPFKSNSDTAPVLSGSPICCSHVYFLPAWMARCHHA